MNILPLLKVFLAPIIMVINTRDMDRGSRVPPKTEVTLAIGASRSDHIPVPVLSPNRITHNKPCQIIPPTMKNTPPRAAGTPFMKPKRP